MKLDFIQDENGAWVLEIKANSDFNLHLERANNYSQDVYLYVRGSSEGEYKLYKKLFGRVIDLDVDIPDAIVPKYYRIKCDSQPTLCEITGDVTNITGQEVKPVGAKNMVYFNNSFVELLQLNKENNNAYKKIAKLMPEIVRGVMDGEGYNITIAEYLGTILQNTGYTYYMQAIALDLNKEFYLHSNIVNTADCLKEILGNLETPITLEDAIEQYGITEEEFFSLSPF